MSEKEIQAMNSDTIVEKKDVNLYDKILDLRKFEIENFWKLQSPPILTHVFVQPLLVNFGSNLSKEQPEAAFLHSIKIILV